MFEIASEVLRWHRSNETGVVARVVSVNGLATRWPAQAIAATPGPCMVTQRRHGPCDAAAPTPRAFRTARLRLGRA
jgi:hypothetical protein